MEALSNWFEQLLFGGARRLAVVTVIGSGGKTSLIWRLAASLSGNRRILVTPATKMFLPEEKLYDRYCSGVPPEPVPGITLAGLFNETSGKLESLAFRQLEKIVPDYDLALIEGDGSRERPLKAWAEDEPVVPNFTDLTIGVLPLWPIGKPVSETLVHRLSLFQELTGAAAGETIKPEHLLCLIPALFAKAKGKKLLFLNQIEDEISLKQARELSDNLPQEFRNGLYGIIAGSVKLGTIEELYQAPFS